MIVQCDRCDTKFEDEYRSTLCPHNAFAANDDNNVFTVHNDAYINSGARYDADYFLRGKQTGKSLYEDYRWLPNLTIPMCQAVTNYLGIKKTQTVLDFGCARGYMVKALRLLGFDAYGQDVSEWAIGNCDADVKQHLKLKDKLTHEFDWIIAKDVLEHVQDADAMVTEMRAHARAGIFVVVPLSSQDGQPYVLTDYELDVTHIHRLTLASWVRMFLHRGWDVKATYRVPGIKDNHYVTAWEPGDGFIVATRK